jgi:hypothetical protein
MNQGEGSGRKRSRNIKSLALSLANAALYLITCTLVGTGLLLELRMDEEDAAARLIGMGRDDWGEIHFAVAVAFAALATLHLGQNWTWIKAAFCRSKPSIVVVFAGLALMAGLLLWPNTSANAPLSEQLRHILTDD